MPDKPQTSCKFKGWTRCKLTTLRSTLPPTFQQFSIQNPGSALTPQPVDPPCTRPPSPPFERPPCGSTLMPVTINYDLQAIADARHSLGSAC